MGYSVFMAALTIGITCSALVLADILFDFLYQVFPGFRLAYNRFYRRMRGR